MDATLTRWLLDHGVPERLAGGVATAGLVAAMLLLAFLAALVTRKLVLPALKRLIVRSQTTWDDALLQWKVLDRLAHLVPALILHMTAAVALAGHPTGITVAQNAALIYLVMASLAVIDAFLNAALHVYERFEISRRIYLRSFVQVFKIVVFFVGIVFILSNLLGKSPLVFLSGLGAFTAVLILVFKDAILGLVAGIQLMANDMVRRGDWIEMPKYGIDGDVLDVSLTTVTVQNWDKTIASVPTYALISDSFKNWRGMSEAGGRRIKRAVHLDMTSIKFCDQEMLDRFKRIQYIRDYVERKLDEIQRHNREHQVDESILVNGRHLTNIGTFRAYLEAYLRHHPKIHQGMTFLVRHLPPGPKGLPIEIYVFSSDTAWANYEAIQADIFDHILAVIPLFDLRVFQEPTGSDVERAAHALQAGAGRPA